MRRITTVIFDMYDTLVQNDPRRWQATFQEIIQQQALDATADRLWQEWRSFDRKFRDSRFIPDAPFRSYYQAWRDAFACSFAALDLPGDADAAVTKAIADLGQRTPYSETVEALWLIQKYWRTAVLSNADDSFLLPNLERLGLDFELVLSSEAARSYKPQPGLFLEALDRLGVGPQESVYVGDRQFEDVQGAGNVGINTVWINRSGEALDPQLPKPDGQISSLLELPDLLLDWLPAEDDAQ